MNKYLILIVIIVLVSLIVFSYLYFRSGREQEIQQEIKQEGAVPFDAARLVRLKIAPLLNPKRAIQFIYKAIH